MRGELGIKHLSRVVYIFSCNIHDASLPLAIQTTSVRLLLNLVENIFHKNDAEGRALLVRILHCLVCKFATLKVPIACVSHHLPPSMPFAHHLPPSMPFAHRLPSLPP